MPSASAKVDPIKVPLRLQAEWEAMKVDARASNQTVPEFILGGWRLRNERARQASAAPTPKGETTMQAYMRGVQTGRLFEELRRALDAGLEEAVDVGWYRRWYSANRMDASRLREWLGALPRGQAYADWWDREIARVGDDRPVGRTA